MDHSKTILRNFEATRSKKYLDLRKNLLAGFIKEHLLWMALSDTVVPIWWIIFWLKAENYINFPESGPVSDLIYTSGYRRKEYNRNRDKIQRLPSRDWLRPKGWEEDTYQGKFVFYFLRRTSVPFHTTG